MLFQLKIDKESKESLLEHSGGVDVSGALRSSHRQISKRNSESVNRGKILSSTKTCYTINRIELMSKKTSKKVVSLKKEIKARKSKIAKQESKLKQLKKKLKKAA